MVKTALPMQGEQVQTLKGELRSCTPHGMAKKIFFNDDSEDPEFRQKQ